MTPGSLVLRLGATPMLAGLAGLISLDADDRAEARKNNFNNGILTLDDSSITGIEANDSQAAME